MTELKPAPDEPLAPGDLQINVTELDGRARVVVRGELDMVTSRMLLEHVGTFAMAQPVLALDLAHLSFVDPTGVRALWTLRQRCLTAGKRFVIERPSAAVVRILRTSGLERAFALEATT